MKKSILFGLFLTTLCTVFEANGQITTLSLADQILRSSQNPFHNGYGDLTQTWANTPSSNNPWPSLWSSPSSLTKHFYNSQPNTGVLTNHHFSFPNGKGTVIQYSKRWDSSNGDTPSFNTNVGPVLDAITRNNQFLDSRFKTMGSFVHRIMSNPLEIQGNKYDKNNGPTINKKPNDLIDFTDNITGSNINKQQQQQQQQSEVDQQQQQHQSEEEEIEEVEEEEVEEEKHQQQKQQQQQQQQNQPTSYSNNSASNGLSKEQINNFRNQVLEQSNYYRQKHGLPIFTTDDDLTNLAQNWADNISRRNIMQHRENNKYGENIYSDSDSIDLGVKAVDAWYNEMKYFQLDDNENDISGKQEMFHMTQLLWRPSSKIGVGVSKSPRGGYFVVVNYDPRGNYIGQFMNNLPEITQEDIDTASENAKAEEALMYQF